MTERKEDESCLHCRQPLATDKDYDGICHDCRLRGAVGRSVINEVSLIRRQVFRWTLLALVALLAILLTKSLT